MLWYNLVYIKDFLNIINYIYSLIYIWGNMAGWKLMALCAPTISIYIFIPSGKTINKLVIGEKVKLIFIILDKNDLNMPYSGKNVGKIKSIDNDKYIEFLKIISLYKDLSYGNEIYFEKKDIWHNVKR